MSQQVIKEISIEDLMIADRKTDNDSTKKVESTFLTEDNYFDSVSNMQYMSASQFKSFKTCSARAIEELAGTYERPKSKAFTQGHYLEALLNNEREEFIEEHKEEMTTKNGQGLYADFKKVESAAKRIQEEQFLVDLMAKCKQQTILTGMIAGVPFKAKMDYFNTSALSVYDTKAMTNFRTEYNVQEGKYEEWYQHWGYDIQIAIYRELIKQSYGKHGTNGLIAVTKDYEPDIDALTFADSDLDLIIEQVESLAPYFQEMKDNKREPERCEKCDYCKETRDITKFRRAMLN